MLNVKTIWFAFLLSPVFLQAQNKYTLFFHPFSDQTRCDSLDIASSVNNYLFDLWARGYLLARADSLSVMTREAHVYIAQGELFTWADLKEGNLPSYLKNKSGYKERFFRQKPFRYSEVATLTRRVIATAEAIGYPFAQIKLDSIEAKNKRISAVLKYEPGPMIQFDSIEVHGSVKIKKTFLQRYLGIQPGAPFDQSRINHVQTELAKLPYIEQERPYMLLFGDNKAKLVLFLKDKKVNYFDGIVGLLPNEGNDRKMLITGQVTLMLDNFFGSGKKLDLEWQRYDKESQLLDLAYVHPVFLGSPLDLGAFFNLLKQDSTFMNIDRGISLSQNLRKFGRIGLFVKIKSSRTIAADDMENRDFNVYQYGLSYQYDNLDNIFFPRKGWRLNSSVSIGNKTTRDPGETDNDIPKKTIQLYGDLRLDKYNKLSRQSALLAAMKNAAVFNNRQAYYIADFYRVGGLKSLRGFNENNFYAQYYTIATLEYRYFLEDQTYLLAFIDQALIMNPLLKRLEKDWPTGLGLGLSFNSGPGVFTFIYSVGRNSEQSFNFNLSKIHFGFISRF